MERNSWTKMLSLLGTRNAKQQNETEDMGLLGSRSEAENAAMGPLQG